MSDLILTEKQNIMAVADAIRSKTGLTEPMTLSEMADNVMNITGSGESGDVGVLLANHNAAPDAHADIRDSIGNTLVSAKDYTNTATTALKNELLNGAGAAYDTLKELGELIDENTTALDALETVAAGKADAKHTHENLYYTKTDIDTALETQAETLINHDVNIFYSSWTSGAENPDGYVEFPRSSLFPTSPSPQQDDLLIAKSNSGMGSSNLLKIVSYDTTYVYCEVLVQLVNSPSTISVSDINAAIATHNTTTNAHIDIRNAKMDKNNPVGTGSFSMNRKADTTVGTHSFAIGSNTTASAMDSYAEGNQTTATGMYSHTEGSNTVAAGNASHVQGKFNIEDTSNTYAHIVGNGTALGRSNAHVLDWDGNAWFQGDVYVGSTSGTNKDGGSKKLATEAYVAEQIASVSPIPTTENWVFTLEDGSTVTKAVLLG